jgi:TetR/AcrR family transcriptional repressor of nem operon
MVRTKMVEAGTDTATRILDVAETLVQTRGFNGFSYADIAEALAITKPSVHHHFSSKADLGLRLVERYHRTFFEALRRVDASGAESSKKLEDYAALYLGVLRQEQRMCLCGMMAADFNTLETPIRDAVQKFFTENETWLTRVMEEGRSSKVLEFDGPAQIQASLFLSSLQGAMLVARSLGSLERFEALTARLLAGLGPRTSTRARKKKPKARPRARR